MARGSCFYGNIQIEYVGQPMIAGLSHCFDCRKLTGGVYSYSFVVKSADLKITGKPKEIAKVADSGNQVRNYFCPDCGTPIYGVKLTATGELGETTLLRAGIFDDIKILNKQKPVAELYTVARVKWVDPLEGADQFTGMVPLP
ncbi:glutathione-dependent formaldehyde-activating enzyme [Penicillium soppii]|uniref:glutathione-dependent formaldehyde-activating enzyme n=1 Tax=Penicillium soppii TaxID=69789 RepID=UPI002548374D|nr:glutathione-dependent formaldehyde-activating enzyme [Penicillium soppii]KAJ5855560.1 glutathione-dependent formaldehyde-activating enzyme [Penicillium soppii]